jgi:hypothetical protein
MSDVQAEMSLTTGLRVPAYNPSSLSVAMLYQGTSPSTGSDLLLPSSQNIPDAGNRWNDQRRRLSTGWLDFARATSLFADGTGPMERQRNGSAKSGLEVLVEQVPAVRYAVGEHIGRHQAQRLAVHAEPFDVDVDRLLLRDVRRPRRQTEPRVDVGSRPDSRICNTHRN